VNRSALTRVLIIVLIIGAAFVWRAASREYAVIKTDDGQHNDVYTSLWVVDEDRWVWLRAGNARATWLGHLAPEMQVELDRSGETRRYEVEIDRNPRTRDRIDRMMQEKYGIAERLRAFIWREPTIPVKLVPVD
jgi:hypothetical protein